MRDPAGELQASDELRGRLKWFLLGRVAVVSGFLVMVAIAFLQKHTLRPVGSETNVAVDVRIVAATNRDLAGKVKYGSFRRARRQHTRPRASLVGSAQSSRLKAG